MIPSQVKLGKTIDYLIEIVFKSIPIEAITLFLKEASMNGSKVIGYSLTCSHVKIDWNMVNSIEKVFSENDNFGLFLNLTELDREGISLPNCGIAVYRAENCINLELNFKTSDLRNMKVEDMTKKLMKLAKSIAARYQVNDYFCGIEPAEDPDTRLFTKEHAGPIFFKDQK